MEILSPSIVPDRDQIERWWGSILKTVTPCKGQEVSIRLFWSNNPNPKVTAPDKIEAVPFETDRDLARIVERTLYWAEWALTEKEQKNNVWVVCPIPQVFCAPNHPNKAKQVDEVTGRERDLTPGGRANLCRAGVLFSEIDARPKLALGTAQARLGKPSMAVASGGLWDAPDGSQEDKLHLYWSIDPAPSTKEEIDRLWIVTAKLKELVDGGDSTVQPVHPMRAGGTVHTKTKTHRLARILDDTGGTITLEEAEDALADVVLGRRSGTKTCSQTTGGVARLNLAKTIEDLLNGGDFHGNVVSLSASLVQRGLGTAEVEDLLKMLVTKSPRAKAEPARVAVLLNSEIRKAVRSAEFKFVQDGFKARTQGRKLWSPFRKEDMARIPLNALHPDMRNWAADRSEMMGVDANGMLGAMIGAASIAANGEISLELAPGYEVPPWVWIMIVGEVSAKKTPAIKAAGASVLNEMAIRSIRAHEAAVQAWEVDIEDNYKGQSVPKSQWPAHPIPGRQHVTTDATPEALAGILAHQDCGIGILIDEICTHLEGFGAYNSGGAKKAVAEVLELWNGDNRIVNRATGGRKGGSRKIVVERWGAGILGGIQTALLEELDGRLIRNGLLARYIPVIMAPATAGTMTGKIDLKFWDRALEAITRIPPMNVKLDLDAMLVYHEFVPQIAELTRLPFSESVRGALGKLQGLVGRLALVLHLIDLGLAASKGEDVGDMDTLTGDTMERAVLLVSEWVIPAVITFWDVMARGKEGSLMQEVGRYILRNPQQRYSVWDFKRNVRSLANADVRKVERALGQFEAGDWLSRGGETRKGQPQWDANQLIWEHFEAEAKEAEEQAVRAKEQWRHWVVENR